MTKQEIGAILKQLRIAQNMTQKEIAEKLGRNQQIIGHWESGYAQPDLDTFIRLCGLYHTTVDTAFGFDFQNTHVSPAEYEHILGYRSLDPPGRQHVDIMMQWEKERTFNVIVESRPSSSPLSRLLAYYTSLSAMCDSEEKSKPHLKIQVPDNELSKHADIVAAITDDSMEDTYHNGDAIYIKKTSDIPYGSIGVYMQDNHIFVRESGHGQLLAHNPAYPDTPADESIIPIGMVLGKVA